MKFLAQLQKNALIWYLIAICTVFTLLRLPSMVEPYWYGDEGIYEVIGQSIDHGKLLYRDIWDNKPPLLYFIYAFAQGDQPTVKALSLGFGLLSVIALFILAYKLFGKSKTTITVTALYAFLFGIPLIEGNIANAENFMLLFTISGGLLLYHVATRTKEGSDRRDLFLIAGLLLGIGLLLKIVVLFDLIAFAFFLLLLQLPAKLSRASVLKALGIYLVRAVPLIIGFITPFIITIISFASLHDLRPFIQAVFFGNVDYVGFQNSLFGIPQGLLLLKALLLVGGVIVIFLNRLRFSKESLFITTWLLFSLFNAFFSGRPYTHYVLVLLPSFCLLVGLGLANQRKWMKTTLLASALAIVVLISQQFLFYPIKAALYYPTIFAFLTGNQDVTSYRSFFDYKTPRDYAVGSFIKNNTTASDTVYIWGDSAQVYILSGKLPTTKYAVAYHLIQNNIAANETQKAIEETKPKYVVTLDEAQPLPFSLPLYIMLFSIPGANIYERHL